MNAQDAHKLALQESEKGNLLEALLLEDQAMVLYQKEGNEKGFAEIQSMRFITFKHLYRSTNDKRYLILAKHCALVSVDLAKLSKDKTALALPLFNLGKAYAECQDYPQAIANYNLSLEEFQKIQDARNSVIADIKGHLTYAEYKKGDKTAKERASAVLEEIKSVQDASKYEHDVWVTGQLMRMAEMLKEDDIQAAKSYLYQAEQITDSNPELIIRKEQITLLKKMIQ